jgi:multidrug efflux pump subunit AcrA (membrane-fusion protein)
VAEILVEEGDLVRAGTPLARLLVTTSTTDGEVGAAISAGLDAEAQAGLRDTSNKPPVTSAPEAREPDPERT